MTSGPDKSIFSSALSYLSSSGRKEAEDEDVDEDDAVQQHKNMYGGESSGGYGGSGGAGSGSMGTAAAMQVRHQVLEW